MTLHSHLEQLILNWQATNGKRLRLKDLQAETGLTRPAIDRYRSGEVDRVYADTVIPLCRFFGCALGDLLTLPEQQTEEAKD